MKALAGEYQLSEDFVEDKWTTQDKFHIVVETAGMAEDDRAEYARIKSVFFEQIKEWRDACINANGGIACF